MSERSGARWAALLIVLTLVACSDHDRARRAYAGGDYAEAARLFGGLAQAGNTSAQFSLALMYFQGIGVTRDPTRGWELLNRSATGGNTAAMVELGARFESGHGAEPNYAMAMSWYRKAGAAGDPVGSYNLAAMYARGAGVAGDAVRAWAWFRVAEKSGSLAAKEQLESLRLRMTEGQLDAARQLAERLRDAPEL